MAAAARPLQDRADLPIETDGAGLLCRLVGRGHVAPSAAVRRSRSRCTPGQASDTTGNDTSPHLHGTSLARTGSGSTSTSGLNKEVTVASLSSVDPLIYHSMHTGTAAARKVMCSELATCGSSPSHEKHSRRTIRHGAACDPFPPRGKTVSAGSLNFRFRSWDGLRMPSPSPADEPRPNTVACDVAGCGRRARFRWRLDCESRSCRSSTWGNSASFARWDAAGWRKFIWPSRRRCTGPSRSKSCVRSS